MNDKQMFAIEEALLAARDANPGITRGDLVTTHLLPGWIKEHGKAKATEMVRWILRESKPGDPIAADEYIALIRNIGRLLTIMENHGITPEDLDEDEEEIMDAADGFRAMAEITDELRRLS